jgi:Niemann-Pick C1 protein
VFLSLFAISCIGVWKLQNGLEEQVSMVSGGDLDNYFTYEKKYIEIGPPAYVVLKGLDYSDPTDVAFVEHLSNSLSHLNVTVQPPIFSWVSGFNLFLNDNAVIHSYHHSGMDQVLWNQGYQT